MHEGEDKIIRVDFTQQPRQESPMPRVENNGGELVTKPLESPELGNFSDMLRNYFKLSDYLRQLQYRPNPITRASHEQSVKRMSADELREALALSDESKWSTNPTYYLVLFEALTAAKLFEGLQPTQ